MTRGWPSWHPPGRSCGSSTAPGNVHHSKGGAERFVRELIGEIRAHLGRRALTLEFRMDAAFSSNICSSCSTAGVASMRSKYPGVGGPG